MNLSGNSKVIIGLVVAIVLFFGLQALLFDDMDEDLNQDEIEELTDDTSVIKGGAARGEATPGEDELPDGNRFNAIDDFSAYIASHDDETTGLLEDDFTHNAFEHLIEAVEVLAEQPQANIDPQAIIALNEQLTQYRENDEPKSTDELKSVFMATYFALESSEITSRKFRMYVDQLKEAANALDESVPLPEQQEQVGDLFEQAVLALETAEEAV